MDAELGLDLDASRRVPLIRRVCRYLSEQSPQPMVAVEGLTHVVIYANPAFTRLVGRDRNDLIGRPFAEAVPESEGNGCLALLDRVFRTGTPENLAEQEHRHDRPEPAYWSYAVWAILGPDERPAGVMVQITDATEVAAFRQRSRDMNEALMVSSVRQHELIETIERGERERRALEAQMYQAQKLESLGIMAGGIAHDLNNVLTPVVGFTELARDSLPADLPAVPMLDAVSENARRAANLVLQILAYTGKGPFVLQPVNLSVLVREMRGLLESAVPVGTELVYDLAPTLPLADADAAQLRQVVINLVTNASEALDQHRGSVTIRTGSIPIGLSRRSLRPATDGTTGPAAFLEVEDTGCGMTGDTLTKAFDPFFTTKFTGRGLGLAVVHGVARAHGGTVEVRSEPGHGSTFRVLFPCSATPVAVPVTPDLSETAWRGTGTVLVVDDERAVRGLTALILERAGFKVLLAGDGPEAVRVFRESPNGINVVVTDLTMPGMSGIETAGQLRELRPNLPVVLMSGFSAQEAASQSAEFGISGFVQKPFQTDELLAAVRHALGSDASARVGLRH